MKSYHILFLVVAFWSLLMVGCLSKQDTMPIGTVVVDSWGGGFQDDQAELIFLPFAEETGVEVVQLSDGENIYAKIQAQANNARGEIDLVHGDASWLMRGKQEGLWAEIDYDRIGPNGVYDDAQDEHGVGILYWSFNIVFNSAKTGGTINTWAEVWEYAKTHPNRVAMWSARPNYVIEASLLATGMQLGDVYPLTTDKLNLAYQKLEEIRDHVVWYETGGQGARLFEENQVDVGMFYGGDAFGLEIEAGEAVVVWNQGIYTRDYWLIPANAPNKNNATELIKFAVQAERQARFSERTGYGPVAPNAISLISADALPKLPSVEPQKSSQLSYDYIWWGKNDDEQLARWTAWLRQ